jgi:putative sterol carrier protein
LVEWCIYTCCEEERQATVVIRDRTITVSDGHVGVAALHVTADSVTWLKFLAKERPLIGALLRRRVHLKGSARLLLAFARCFAI